MNAGRGGRDDIRAVRKEDKKQAVQEKRVERREMDKVWEDALCCPVIQANKDRVFCRWGERCSEDACAFNHSRTGSFRVYSNYKREKLEDWLFFSWELHPSQIKFQYV